MSTARRNDQNNNIIIIEVGTKPKKTSGRRRRDECPVRPAILYVILCRTAMCVGDEMESLPSRRFRDSGGRSDGPSDP